MIRVCVLVHVNDSLAPSNLDFFSHFALLDLIRDFV